jgi:LuxR family maltose regulon positive regulatory protein
MQISERDNMSWRFWENFIQAVGFLSRETAEKLTKNGFPKTERQFERYLNIPIQDINLKTKYLFVYDDFHLIQDPAVLRFMEHSITTPFPNITSIIISRSELKFPDLSPQVKNRLVKITEENLRFSRDEMTEYFRLLGISVSMETAAEVYRDTEGWAFAIHLAALAFKNDSAAGTKSREAIGAIHSVPGSAGVGVDQIG